MVEVDAGVVLVALVVLVVLAVPAPEPPISDDPPVVDVSVETEFDVPAPVPPVFPVTALEPELELELEFEPVLPDPVELEPEPEAEFDDEDFFEPPPVAVVACVAGLAALVVGTLNAGAPVASLVAVPLPPHAASDAAMTTAAPPAIRPRW